MTTFFSSRTFPGRVVLEEPSHDLGCHFLSRGGAARGRSAGRPLCKEVLHEKRDVVAALPQGGDGKHRGVQPVVEVLPKLAFSYQVSQVLVRRGDEPNVHTDGLVSAQAPDLVVLKRPEDLRLDAERHVPDLVEEKCAPIRLLEQSLEDGIRPRVCAFLMAEKLIIEESLWKCDAVDLHHLHGASGRGGVDIVGKHFFPRPAFPADQHGKISGGQLFHLADQGAHSRISRHDGRGQLLEAVSQPHILVAEPGELTCPLNRFQKLVEVQRLLHVIESTKLERLNGAVHRGVGRDHDDRHVLVHGKELLEDIDPAFLSQHDVQQDGVHPRRRKTGQGFLPGGGDRGREPHVLEVARKASAQLHLVVDDEEIGPGALLVDITQGSSAR